MKFHIEDSFHTMRFRVFAFTEINGVQRRFHQPDGSIIVVDIHTNIEDIKPLFEVEYHSAANLIAALQQVGIRPVELSKVEGQLDAQTAHLKDLQSILKKQGYMG